MKKIGIILGFLICVGVGFWFRYKNFSFLPFPGTSMDEYSYSWVGLSLIKTGMPVGISGIEGYKNQEYKYINVDHVYSDTAKGNPSAINWPWFDHPPLMGLITGGYAYTKGARVFEETTASIIRKPMVVLGTISVGLVFILGCLWYSPAVGMIAGLIYATSPFVVFGSRMIQAENGIVLCFLGMMILLNIFYKRKGYVWLAAAGVVAGLAVWFKVAGGDVFLAGVAYILLAQKNKKEAWKNIVFLGLMFVPFVVWFVMYGVSIDAKQFVAILFSNSSRFYGIGSGAIWDLISKTRLTHNLFLTEPWILSGWIAFFVVLTKKKKSLATKMNIIVVLIYLATYLFFGSYPYGWYSIPLWPFLILLLAKLMVSSLKRGTTESVVLSLVPVGYLMTKFITTEQFQGYAGYWRMGMVLIFGLGVLRVISPGVKLYKYGLIICGGVFVLAGIGLNMAYFLSFTVDTWYKIM